MPQDDDAARKARAKKLRKQIREITHAKEEPCDDPESEAPPESPRDFIHRRMMEDENKDTP